MKKLVSFILSLCLAFSMAIGLAACGPLDNYLGNDQGDGKGNFSTGWTYDENYHWHKSVDADSTEISDKGEHVFTSTVNGDVKTYRCSCGYTYTETVFYANNFAASFSGKNVNLTVTGENEGAEVTISKGETSPELSGSKYVTDQDGVKTTETTYDSSVFTTYTEDGFVEFLRTIAVYTSMETYSLEDSLKMLGAMSGEDVSSYLDGVDMSIVAKLGNMLVKTLSDVVFDTVETESGYTITLNADRLTTLVNNVYEKKISELLDIYVGEGTYEKVQNFVFIVINGTVADLNEFLIENGINVVELYQTVYGYIPAAIKDGEEVELPTPETVATLIDTLGSAYVFNDVIKPFINDPELDAEYVQGMVDEIFGSTLFEAIPLIMSYIPESTFGGNKYEGGEYYDDSNDDNGGYVYEGGEYYDGSDDDNGGYVYDGGEYYDGGDYYGDDESGFEFEMPPKEYVLAYLDGLSLVINTDKEGYLVSLTITAKIGEMIGFKSETVTIEITLSE